MKPVYTIAQVLACPEGQFVSADIFVTVGAVKAPAGKGPFTAQLHDATGTIVGKFWGGDVSHWTGKRVKLSGMGMQRKAYKDVPELSVGQKAEISFAGAPGAAAQMGNEGDFGDVTAQTSDNLARYTKAAPNAPSVARNAQEHLPVNLPHGATVGGALARAVDIWLAINAQAPNWTPDAVGEVEQITRDLVEIQGRIERGEPAKSEVPF